MTIKEKIILAIKIILQILIIWFTWGWWADVFGEIFYILFLILNIIAMAGMILKHKWGNLLYIILMSIGVFIVICWMVLLSMGLSTL